MALVDRYIEVTTFKASVLVAAGLTALFSLLEFVEQLASVGQGHYHVADALIYVLLTAPYRLLQVAPASTLLGSLLALGFLDKNLELTAMRGLGVSEHRIMGRIAVIAAPILLALFLLAEFVIPTAQRLAQELRSSALTSLTALRSDNSFWAHGADQYLNVQHFESGNVPRDIDIYAFSHDGELTDFIHADRADIRPDGNWQLIGVIRKRVEASRFQTEHLASLSWRSFITAKQTQLLLLPPESMPPVALFRYIQALRRHHQQATRYEEELWSKLSAPFSIIAMIMIAAPFAFTPPRGKNIGRQVSIGAAIGIVFSLFQQILSQLDLLLDLNPAATALAPSLLLIILSIYLFRHAHR